MISWDCKRFVITGLFSGISVAILTRWMHAIQPDPYMDEVFHVPQVQRYCYGDFKTWDPKITTLPGLYLITIGIVNPFSKILEAFFCDTFHLRCISVIFSSLNLLVLQRISVQIHGAKHYYDENKCLLSSLNLSLFPVLYFFNFLYYTDSGSTFMVLLMYCLHLERRDWFASFIGGLAVLFRQTNIIWVAFVAVQAAGPHWIHSIHTIMIRDKKNVKFNLTFKGRLKELFYGTIELFYCYPREASQLLVTVVIAAGGYIMVGIGFLIFLVINGGIVVGDRSAHAAIFHPTQILYFCGFSLVFSASFCITKAFPFFFYVRKRWKTLFLCGIIAYGIVREYSLAHPYLLADNRHYTFYVWRKIINRTEWTKYAAVPFYVFGGFCILYSLRKSGFIFQLSFPVFVALNLTPQLLLEFRYFILPYLFYRLQVRPKTWWKLSVEFVFYVVVNLITIYLFYNSGFEWNNEPGKTQRFMW